MATGYTYPVKEGEVTDFAEFAMQCAQAFGALIMMRDSSKDAVIPAEILPDNEYNERTAAGYRARLAEIDGWDPQRAEAARDAAYANAVAAQMAANKTAAIERERYEAMLAKVEAWTPPTDEHVGLKEFMVDQLTSSIKFDGFTMPDPERLSVNEFVRRERAQAARILGIYEQNIVDEVERAASRTAWVRALRDSLAEVPA